MSRAKTTPVEVMHMQEHLLEELRETTCSDMLPLSSEDNGRETK